MEVDYKAFTVVNLDENDLKGKRWISTKWVKRKKFDADENRIIRCRLVCREMRCHDPRRAGLFAPSTSVGTSRIVAIIAVKRDLP